MLLNTFIDPPASVCNLEGVGGQYKTRLVSPYYKKGRDLRHGPVFIVLILKQSGLSGLYFIASSVVGGAAQEGRNLKIGVIERCRFGMVVR